MTDSEYEKEINDALDKAEKIWECVEPKLVDMSESIASIENFSNISSNIPGHKKVNPLVPEVDNFIAFVLDIRNSSEHLLQACSSARVECLERVLYETTAINTIGAIVINETQGAITEFLGDGFLALYKAIQKNKNTLYAPYNAAKKCLRVTQNIVNPILKKRYNLEPLRIGIGLAYSKAIVTVVGNSDNLYPKAIGECVFRASKLSDGYDEIYFDKPLRLIWPRSKTGNMIFKKQPTKKHNIEYYVFERKS